MNFFLSRITSNFHCLKVYGISKVPCLANPGRVLVPKIFTNGLSGTRIFNNYRLPYLWSYFSSKAKETALFLKIEI